MLTVLQHPLITHKLAIMRDKDTGTKDFRQNLSEIGSLMAYEISRNLPTELVSVQTPVATCYTQKISKEIVLVPILRAGLGMVDGIANIIPTVKIGHIGLYRDEETLEPHEYFFKMPADADKAVVYVVDPMLATGGSASAAITLLKGHGIKNIKLVCLVGVMEGVNKVQSEHPDVDIYLAALDEKLNEKGYIVPGLGDAGDRIFGTK